MGEEERTRIEFNLSEEEKRFKKNPLAIFTRLTLMKETACFHKQKFTYMILLFFYAYIILKAEFLLKGKGLIFIYKQFLKSIFYLLWPFFSSFCE
jgi:hypothetical protein